MFAVEQKKGLPLSLDGRITVYAAIDADPDELSSAKHSFAAMVHNGLLVSQGNFKDQYNFRDFLKSEFGISLDEGLEEGLTQLLERVDGIESTLDPAKLKERLESMDDLNDFIPTPAKIVPFHSEEEILDQEGDVFFAGTFRHIGNAVLSVQALPMLYQARYREQELVRVRNEIESLLTQIERNDSGVSGRPAAPVLSTQDHLLKEYIPQLLYSRREPHAFEKAADEFRAAMRQYRYHEDIESIIAVIAGSGELTEKDNRLLELYAKKIACVEKEDFASLDAINRDIGRLRGKP